jgi:DNA-binding NarL/FixJ family response regulator
MQTLPHVPPPRYSVSIVSDSRLMSNGVAALLGAHLDLVLEASYHGWPPRPAAAVPVDHTVLIDGGLEPGRLLDWIRFWYDVSPPVRIVVIDLPDDVDGVVACIEAGAAGYTLLGASVVELVDAVRASRDQQAYCSPQVASQVFARLSALGTARRELPANRHPLTQRELEVLRYINQDYSNRQIADALLIEVSTVKHHVHNILDKMRLRHRWDAARIAADQGWIPPEETHERLNP